MARKTWIKVKRGLLEPKHIERLGVRFFLYLYYLDQADWEQGAVLFYRDRDAADELGIPISTVRKQRVKLEDDGYISCLQKKDHQRITIHNWTNPREYSGKIYNESTQKGKPLNIEDNNKDNHKGNHKGITTMGTPSSTSHITNHISHRQEFIYKFISTVRVDFTNSKQPQKLDDLVEDYGEDLILEVAQWCQDKQMTSMGQVLSSMEGALKRGWNQKPKGKQERMMEALDGMKEE